MHVHKYFKKLHVCDISQYLWHTDICKKGWREITRTTATIHTHLFLKIGTTTRTILSKHYWRVKRSALKLSIFG